MFNPFSIQANSDEQVIRGISIPYFGQVWKAQNMPLVANNTCYYNEKWKLTFLNPKM